MGFAGRSTRLPANAPHTFPMALFEVGAECRQSVRARGVKIASEPGAGATTQRARAATFHRALRKHFSDRDQSQRRPPAKGEGFVST